LLVDGVLVPHLIGDQAAEDGEEQGGGQSEGQEAVDRLEGAEQPPLIGQLDVAVAQRRVVLHRKVEGRFPSPDLPAQNEGRRPEGDLCQVRSRRNEHDDCHDGGVLRESQLAAISMNPLCHTHHQAQRHAIDERAAQQQGSGDQEG